jgi:hypothetical protein
MFLIHFFFLGNKTKMVSSSRIMRRFLYVYTVVFIVMFYTTTHSVTCTQEQVGVETKVHYSLANHRALTQRAFDSVKRSLGLHLKPKEDLFESARTPEPKKKTGFLASMANLVSNKLSVWSAKVTMKLGNGISFLFDSKSDAMDIIEDSHTFEEYVSRVNLRLGVTYPDVPLAGNKPISLKDSLRKVSLRLYTMRHIRSASLDAVRGITDLAATHEGTLYVCVCVCVCVCVRVCRLPTSMYMYVYVYIYV